MTGTKVVKTDSEIQHDVLEELKWDTRVDETDVGVEVDQTVVTLTGRVDSYAKKLAAQEAAHRVAGVLDVANDIEVRIPDSAGRTDTEIAQAVRHALEWDVLVPEERIHATVSGGIVTLEGTVDAWTERDDAARAVRRLIGVRDIINRIGITPHYAQLEQVRSAIEDALARRAEREAERITVTIEDGTVRLSGIVRSWTEKRAVIGAAAHAPGVSRLEDDLRIEPVA